MVGMETRGKGRCGRMAGRVGRGPEHRVCLVEVESSRADLRRDDNNERTREKLVAKSESIDRAVELTKRVLSATAKRAVDSQDSGDRREGSGDRSRAVAIAEADARAFVRKSESTKKRIEVLSLKFHDPAYMRCADYHSILVPYRLIQASEISGHWRLLH